MEPTIIEKNQIILLGFSFFEKSRNKIKYQSCAIANRRGISVEIAEAIRGQVSRACCPNPFLSLRAPTIKNCNGRGVAISLYFMRLLPFDKLRASCSLLVMTF
ncbi:hypothetical protein ES705_13763 [subsurface metagenome]